MGACASYAVRAPLPLHGAPQHHGDGGGDGSIDVGTAAAAAKSGPLVLIVTLIVLLLTVATTNVLLARAYGRAQRNALRADFRSASARHLHAAGLCICSERHQVVRLMANFSQPRGAHLKLARNGSFVFAKNQNFR